MIVCERYVMELIASSKAIAKDDSVFILADDDNMVCYNFSRIYSSKKLIYIKKIQMEFEQIVSALEFKLQPKVFVEYSL